MATLADGTTIRVRTYFFDQVRGVANIQIRHDHPVYGTNNKPCGVNDFALNDSEELDEEGDVVSASNEASDFDTSRSEDHDNEDAGLALLLAAHPDIPGGRRDITAEKGLKAVFAAARS
jgi:hypothetical protein